VQAARDLLDVFEDGFEVSFDAVKRGPKVVELAGERGPRPLDVEAEGDESLLCAVVEVALDALPRLIAGADDALA